MKQFSIFTLAALALTAVVACNRESSGVEPEVPHKGQYVLGQITASLGDDTKTSLNGTTKVVNWSTGDRIAVMGSDGDFRRYILESGAGTPIGKFKPENVLLSASYTDVSELVAVYPAASVSAGEVSISINQDLNDSERSTYGISSWNNNSVFSFANNDIKVAKPANTSGTNAAGLNFKFKQLGTWCTFTIDATAVAGTPYSMESINSVKISTRDNKGISGSAVLNTTTLELAEGDEQEIDWILTSPLALNAPASFSLMMFPEVTSSSAIQVTLNTPTYELVFQAKPILDFAAGTTLTFPIQMDANFTEVDNLISSSNFNYTRENTLVNPIVYYGGINCLLLADENGLLAAGELDVTPYATDAIYRNTGTAADGAAVAHAIIWKESTLSFSHTIDDSKLKISGASGYGNAVVGIYDSSDNLLWSYHIWRPEEGDGNNPAKEDNLREYTKTSSEMYRLMPMPIGATRVVAWGDSDADKVKGAGLYYQWGRKDPLGRPSSMTTTSAPLLTVYDTDGNAVSFENIDQQNVPSYTTGEGAVRIMLDYATANPMTFICVQNGVNNNNWAVLTDNYLWGNPATSGYPRMNATYKSIYDPCPKGYRVAPRDTWINFTTNGANCYDVAHPAADWKSYFNVKAHDTADRNYVENDKKYNKDVNTGAGKDFSRGWDFYYQSYGSDPIDFYLASGALNRLGTSTNVGTAGYLWSSSPAGSNGGIMTFFASRVDPVAGNGRATGFPVRCVKE